MQLTEKALRCQELGADKTLSFGCIIYEEPSDAPMGRTIGGYIFVGSKQDTQCTRYDKIIGHPLNRGRLCYLERTKQNVDSIETWNALYYYFRKTPELYNQTILDRQYNDKLMNLILDFLLSLQDK